MFFSAFVFLSVWVSVVSDPKAKGMLRELAIFRKITPSF